jgi:hypothetical protein
MLSFDTDTTSSFYSAMDYMVQVNAATGAYYLYVAGANPVSGTSAALTTCTNIALAYDGTAVRLFADATEIFAYSSGVPTNGSYFAKVHAFGHSSTIIDLQSGPFTDRSWANIGGTGRPADNADVTATHTAAAITGQGALATASSAAWMTQVTGTGKPADNADVTATHTAAAITGQGSLATANAADWSTQVTGTNRPADNAGTALTLVAISGSPTIIGNSMARTTNIGDFDAKTVERITGPVVIKGRVGTGMPVAIGLSSRASPTGYAQADVMLHVSSGNTVKVFQDGSNTQVMTVSGAGLGSLMQIVVDDLYARFYIDGVAVGTPVAVTAGTAWRGYAIGSGVASVTDMAFYAANNANWAAVGGTGRPSDNADVTATHTAAAITGQGSLATQSSAAWTTQVSGRPTELTDGRITAGINSDGTVATNNVSTTALTLGSVTSNMTMQKGSSTTGNGAYQSIVSGSVTLAAAGQVFFLWGAAQGYSSQVGWGVQLWIDGSQVVQRSGSAYLDAPTLTWGQSLTAGTHTVEIRWYGANANLTLSADILYVQGNLR